MSTPKRDYDSTVARMAGNILSNSADYLYTSDTAMADLALRAVTLARLIVQATKNTESEVK